jgi:ankyrin repeat protein
VLAAHSGNADLLQFLLDKDANPNAAKAGYTALHAAILRGNVKGVEVLLNHGADANAKLMASTPTRRDAMDYYYHPAFVGATPFWIAARFSQPAMMKLLAAHGADAGFVHTVSYWGRRGKDSKYTRTTPGAITPMMAALGMGGGAGFSAPPPSEREARALECIKVAVEAGAPVNAAGEEGRTALEVATALRYQSVIDYLTSKGAKLDRPARPLPRVRVADNN